MVGAAVLLVALIVVVPAVLDGRGDLADGTGPATPAIDLRTHTIQVDDVAPVPPVPRPADPPPPAASAPPTADGSASPLPAATLPAATPVTDAGGPPAGPPPVAALPAAEPREAATIPASPPEPAPGVAGTVTPAPPVAPAPRAPPGEWLVQLGSFARRDNASRLADAVRARGFAADVSAMRGSDGQLYRVRVGPPTTRTAADARARALAAAGYRGSVTRQ